MLLLLSTIIIGMSRWFVSEEDGCRKGDLDLMAYLLALLLLCATYARDEVCQVMESVDRLKINHKSNVGKNILQNQHDTSTWHSKLLNIFNQNISAAVEEDSTKVSGTRDRAKKPLRETSFIPKSVNATNQGVSRTHNPWILFMLETLERFIQKLMRPVQLG